MSGDVTQADGATRLLVAQTRAVMDAWLDQAHGRSSDLRIVPTGWVILGLLCGLVLLFPSVARRLQDTDVQTAGLRWGRLAVIVGVVYGIRLRLRPLCGQFLASLGGAVALDFQGLFFLLIIPRVLVLSYLVFGPMGRQAAR
jgi:uncharacterized membrane protein YhaH (DUF805 family)